jgi:hypothetical protein
VNLAAEYNGGERKKEREREKKKERKREWEGEREREKSNLSMKLKTRLEKECFDFAWCPRQRSYFTALGGRAGGPKCTCARKNTVELLLCT